MAGKDPLDDLVCMNARMPVKRIRHSELFRSRKNTTRKSK